MRKKQLIGSLLLTLTALIWGTAFVFQRAGMDRIEPISFTASRMTLAALAVGLAAVLRTGLCADDRNKKIFSKSEAVGGVCCGAFLASASIFQQIGIVYTTAGKAGFITALYILIVPVLSFILFRRRCPRRVWAAVALGVAGMYLLCVTERFSLACGDALLCVCAVLFSGHILCCGHFARAGDPVRVSAVQFAAAAVISWVAALIAESPSAEKILSAAVPILYCGVISGGVGYTLQITAQKHTDPAVASLLMSLEAVFAVIAGALILGERLTARESAGCAVMFAAIVIVQLPAGGKTPPRETQV